MITGPTEEVRARNVAYQVTYMAKLSPERRAAICARNKARRKKKYHSAEMIAHRKLHPAPYRNTRPLVSNPIAPTTFHCKLCENTNAPFIQAPDTSNYLMTTTRNNIGKIFRDYTTDAPTVCKNCVTDYNKNGKDDIDLWIVQRLLKRLVTIHSHCNFCDTDTSVSAPSKPFKPIKGYSAADHQVFIDYAGIPCKKCKSNYAACSVAKSKNGVEIDIDEWIVKRLTKLYMPHFTYKEKQKTPSKRRRHVQEQLNYEKRKRNGQ